AANGQAAAAPPSRVMNSRRFMCCLNPRIAAYHGAIGNTALCITASWAAQCLIRGSSGPIGARQRAHVRFAPIATQLLHGTNPPLARARSRKPMSTFRDHAPGADVAQ